MNLATYQATSLHFDIDGSVATLTLNRPERKNPITFDSYAEMATIFQAAATSMTRSRRFRRHRRRRQFLLRW